MEEQCFSPQSSPIFTIPSLCPSCHVEGASKGVSSGAEAFIKNALHSVSWLLHVDSHILSCTCSQTKTFFSLIVAKTFQHRKTTEVIFWCISFAPMVHHTVRKNWEKDNKRGTLYLTAEHKLSWFRLLIGEGTFQCLNPIQSFLREVDSCTWEKVMNWMTNKNKNSILFQPRSGSICSSSLVFMLIIVLNTIINDKKHHYNISLEKHCNNLLHPDDTHHDNHVDRIHEWFIHGILFQLLWEEGLSALVRSPAVPILPHLRLWRPR